MGCSISCDYFDLFSSFIEWVVSCQAGPDNYLDDFLFLGKANSDYCFYLLTELCIVCRDFSIPLTHEKSVSLTSVGPFSV